MGILLPRHPGGGGELRHNQLLLFCSLTQSGWGCRIRPWVSHNGTRHQSLIHRNSAMQGNAIEFGCRRQLIIKFSFLPNEVSKSSSCPFDLCGHHVGTVFHVILTEELLPTSPRIEGELRRAQMTAKSIGLCLFKNVNFRLREVIRNSTQINLFPTTLVQ